MYAATNNKELFDETLVGDTTVVTALTLNGYETRVIGGILDGEMPPVAKTEKQARYNHKWLAKLVREAESSSGIRLRREVESN